MRLCPTGIISTAARRVSPPGRRAENQVALVLSESSVPQFLAHVLSMPEATIGIWRIEVFPMKTALIRQPLHKMPAQKITFTLRLQRRASAHYAPDHKAMLQAFQALLLRLRPAGGKIYPPYSPILSRNEWREHYGAETWRRFAAAKKQFDSNNVLMPGAGIFYAHNDS